MNKLAITTSEPRYVLPGCGVALVCSPQVRSSVLVVGGGSGFIAQALGASLKPGSNAAFDVLVFDASASKESLAMAEAAIESGKRVVIDGTGETNADLASKLGGMAPAADAVMVMKAKDEDGYIVVPIDNAPNAAKRKLAAQAANPTVAAADLQVNTVQSVFGRQQAADPILQEPFPVVAGQLQIPDRPGIGIEWDEDAVRRYAV